MSRPRGRFTWSKARQGDSLRHQIPAPCPHSLPPPHRIYIDRCINHLGPGCSFYEYSSFYRPTTQNKFAFTQSRNALIVTKQRRPIYLALIISQGAASITNNHAYAPIDVNPKRGECGQGAGIWCLRLSPLSGFWSCEATPGWGHLTLTDRSLVSIQKRLPSLSLEAFWKSRCWRKVWSFHLF